MSIDATTLGGRIKLARSWLGMKQEELSDLSGVSLSALRGYEVNRNDPSLFNITCIADTLEVSLDWLAGREEKEWIDTSLKAYITRLKNCQK